MDKILYKLKSLTTLYVDLNDSELSETCPKLWSAQTHYKYGIDYITIPKGAIFTVYEESYYDETYMTLWWKSTFGETNQKEIDAFIKQGWFKLKE